MYLQGVSSMIFFFNYAFTRSIEQGVSSNDKTTLTMYLQGVSSNGITTLTMYPCHQAPNTAIVTPLGLRV